MGPTVAPCFAASTGGRTWTSLYSRESFDAVLILFLSKRTAFQDLFAVPKAPHQTHARSRPPKSVSPFSVRKTARVLLAESATSSARGVKLREAVASCRLPLDAAGWITLDMCGFEENVRLRPTRILIRRADRVARLERQCEEMYNLAALIDQGSGSVSFARWV